MGKCRSERGAGKVICGGANRNCSHSAVDNTLNGTSDTIGSFKVLLKIFLDDLLVDYYTISLFVGFNFNSILLYFLIGDPIDYYMTSILGVANFYLMFLVSAC